MTPRAGGGWGGGRGVVKVWHAVLSWKIQHFRWLCTQKPVSLTQTVFLCAALRNSLMGFRIAKSGMCSWKPPARLSLSTRLSRSTICYQVLKRERRGNVLWNLWNKTKYIFQTRGLYCGFPVLSVHIFVLQLVLDPCKDLRLLSPPVVQWQRGETWSPQPQPPPRTRKCLQCLASGTS